MIVTVTANTTLDLTLYVASFNKDTTMRALSNTYSMGGKPTDASWILGEMGIQSLALGFAAGALGKKVEALLHAQNVITDFIEVGGDTRVNTIIVDNADRTMSTITTSSLEVSPEHIEALYKRFEGTLQVASVVVTGGTLPKAVAPEFYTRIIGIAHDHHVPIVFDAAQPNLSAGLQAKPTFIKPNRDELAAFAGHPIETLRDAYKVGREIVEKFGTSSAITLGADGALAVLPDRAYRIPPIKVEVVSAAGAGDAVLAGIAASLHRGQAIEDGLRLGVAAATAVLLMPGTAQCKREDIERFLPQVELIPYSGQTDERFG